MVNCSRCSGTGYEYYEDDGRMQKDACYHCGATGQVDEETDFHDQLAWVATAMAYESVKQSIRNMNDDPDGEGFYFHAAENMMSPHDMEQSMVYERVGDFLENLDKLSSEEQKEYVRKLHALEEIQPI
ncbi:MAG: hypothetical protein WC657_05620 [Candidatus Paceibacterota bacterium]